MISIFELLKATQSFVFYDVRKRLVMNFRWDVIVDSIPLLLVGAGTTLKISFLSVLIGLLIGVIAGVARISPIRLVRWASTVYIDIIRGVPLLVQIFLIYFGTPALAKSLGLGVVRMDPFYSAIAACGINSGAYVGEIIRSGIQSIDKGQMEAGRSLGMSYLQTMGHVIMPQAFKRILPPLGNEFIAMLKESSLVAVIGYEELTRSGQLIIARTYSAFEIWLSVAFIYLIMTLTISQFVAWLERRYQVNS